MKTLYTLFSLSIVLIFATAGTQNENGKAGKTKAPGETSCFGCHSGTPENTGGGSISLTSDIPSSGYVPGTTYVMNLIIAQNTINEFGFGVEALRAVDNVNAGTFVITDATRTKILNVTVTSQQRANVVQTSAGAANTNSASYSFNWTAPSSDSGMVKFYFAGVASTDGDNTSGDFVYYDSVMVLPVGIFDKYSTAISFSVFPNPVSENMTIRFSTEANSEVSFTLNDLQGRTIQTYSTKNYSQGFHSEKFALPSDIAKGVYFLMQTTNGIKQIQKITIL